MADWKKAYFPKSPILKIFWRKFHGLVLGLVGLNDAKPIDLAQPIWRWGCLKKALKQAKNVFFVFLGPFRAYVGQPQGHIGWAISMGFASFNPVGQWFADLSLGHIKLFSTELFWKKNPFFTHFLAKFHSNYFKLLFLYIFFIFLQLKKK